MNTSKLSLDELAAQIESRDFWGSIVPGFNITEDSPVPFTDPFQLDEREVERQIGMMKFDGYLAIDELIPVKDLSRLCNAMCALARRGIHPIYLCVYDELWSIFRRLSPVITQMLGEDVSVLPTVWAWCVDSSNRTAFAPHRDDLHNDFLEADGRPTQLTVWIPLADVSTMESCMYVLPASVDVNYPDNLNCTRYSEVGLVRALPARAGSVLGWTLGLLHWGSQPSPLGRPRYSISCIYQRLDRPALYEPWIDLSQPLPLKLRIALIGRFIREYERELTPQLITFAQSLESLHESTRKAETTKVDKDSSKWRKAVVRQHRQWVAELRYRNHLLDQQIRRQPERRSYLPRMKRRLLQWALWCLSIKPPRSTQPANKPPDQEFK